MESSESLMTSESSDMDDSKTETDSHSEETREQNLSNEFQIDTESQREETVDQNLSNDSPRETEIRYESTEQNLSNDIPRDIDNHYETTEQNIDNESHIGTGIQHEKTMEQSLNYDSVRETEIQYEEAVEQNMSNARQNKADIHYETMEQNVSNVRAAPKRKLGSSKKKKKSSKKSGKKMKVDVEAGEKKQETFDESSLEMRLETPIIPIFQDIKYEAVMQKTLSKTSKSAEGSPKTESGEGKPAPSHLKRHQSACTEFSKTLMDLRTEFWASICTALDEVPPELFSSHVRKNIFKFFLMYAAQINTLEDSLITSKLQLIKEGLTVYKMELGRTASGLIDHIILTHELFEYAVNTGKLELTKEGTGQRKTYDVSRVQFYNQMILDVFNVLRKLYNFAVAGDSYAMEGIQPMIGAMRMSALEHLRADHRSKVIHVA